MFAARLDLYANPALRRRLQRLENVPVEVAQQTAIEVAQKLTEEARRNLRIGGPRGLRVRSGKLRNNTEVDIRQTPSGSSIRLRTLFYGLVNARGMVIRPKRGPYLVFRGSRGWARVKSVTIPKRDWDVAALEAARRDLPAIVSRSVVARTRLTGLGQK